MMENNRVYSLSLRWFRIREWRGQCHKIKWQIKRIHYRQRVDQGQILEWALMLSRLMTGSIVNSLKKYSGSPNSSKKVMKLTNSSKSVPHKPIQTFTSPTNRNTQSFKKSTNLTTISKTCNSNYLVVKIRRIRLNLTHSNRVWTTSFRHTKN